MVTPDELADAASASRPTNDAAGRVIEPQSDDRPGLDDLREELNSQFESIKIVSPGQYELNLMELYDRQEYIISLQEDGRYVIEVPDTWDDRTVE
ncbi:OapC/ArvC family zinc-ribbon domain-containing protein [Salinigranum sp. GCM10025319]|uniref:OapC/ArvC family zinc-ribbon domain-containing protein n=1 Tax=Salinigranum sp. GCM10025319 TaxID=3252687 RepID=UPI00361CC255